MCELKNRSYSSVVVMYRGCSQSVLGFRRQCCELKKRFPCNTFGCDKNSVVGKYFLANIVVHCRICCRNMLYIVVCCRTLTYTNQMFDKVQQTTKVVERTYLTNVENTNFIANSWL